MNRGRRKEDACDCMKVFEHFEIDIEEKMEKRQEFDFLIYEKEKLKNQIGNLAKFAML